MCVAVPLHRSAMLTWHQPEARLRSRSPSPGHMAVQSRPAAIVNCCLTFRTLSSSVARSSSCLRTVSSAAAAAALSDALASVSARDLASCSSAACTTEAAQLEIVAV